MSTKTIRKSKNHNPASVPGKEFFKSYISRKIGEHTEFDIFDFARDNKENVLIEGPTGPGKTSAVLAYAAREGRKFYAIPSNIGIEPSQLFGKYIPNEDGGFDWIDGPVTTLIREGGVLLINEVNFMPERVATVLFGLLDKRRQVVLLDHKAEVIDAADDLLIIADMNPDYEGTRPLNKAFRNRFSIQLHWDYDPEVEGKLIQSPELLNMATNLRQEASRGTYETPISTNMLMEFERVFAGLGIEFAITNFVNHFQPEERGAVKIVCDTWKSNIITDLTSVDDDSTDDEEDDGLTSAYDEDDPIWQKRENAPEGYEDPEWGIKGVDWVYED